MTQATFLYISLLRLVCKHQPAFLDRVRAARLASMRPNRRRASLELLHVLPQTLPAARSQVCGRTATSRAAAARQRVDKLDGENVGRLAASGVYGARFQFASAPSRTRESRQISPNI